MDKIIVKKCINGKIEKVREFAIADVKQIQNTEDGLIFVFNDRAITFYGQGIVEFE